MRPKWDGRTVLGADERVGKKGEKFDGKKKVAVHGK
jgi:hypothetical protein